jgi:hypothetical protein
MNAVADLQPSIPVELFAEARARVNEWRGRCVDGLVRAEAAVTECLLAMSEVPERGGKVALPHLVGQRYAALAAAISEGGAFASEGAQLVAALGAFREYDVLRTALCHGVGRVTLDQKAQLDTAARSGDVQIATRGAEHLPDRRSQGAGASQGAFASFSDSLRAIGHLQSQPPHTCG